MKLIDVSISLSPSTPVWPDAPKFECIQSKLPVGCKQVKTDSRLSMIPHCGTHIDAPLHYDSSGIAIDAINLDLLNGPCIVVEYKGCSHISKSDIESMQFDGQKRVLIKTANSFNLHRGKLGSDYISLLPGALDHMRRKGVKILGVDGFSIGPYGALSDRNHVMFCRSGGIIIEMLDLSTVEAGRYILFAMPLKIENFEAAPARVALARPEAIGSFLKD